MDGRKDGCSACQSVSQQHYTMTIPSHPVSSCSWDTGDRFHVEVEEGLRINVMTDYIHFHDDIMETDWN